MEKWKAEVFIEQNSMVNEVKIFVDFLGIVVPRLLKVLKESKEFSRNIRAVLILTNENVSHNNLLNRNQFWQKSSWIIC